MKPLITMVLQLGIPDELYTLSGGAHYLLTRLTLVSLVIRYL